MNEFSDQPIKKPDREENPVISANREETPTKGPRSLRELIDLVSGRGYKSQAKPEDAGLVEILPFPFLALVSQKEMKLALILALINPALGGVLLIGPRGTGKSTAVRSLVDLLPEVPRSLCYYGCMPEDIKTGGIDAVCPDCAQKFAMDEPLATMDKVRLVELPLNSRMEDVIGGLDERAAIHERISVRRGLLAQADRNLLYIDEVNLLDNEIVDAILDAASQGSFTVRRGPIAATYRSRFTLIGSMNPEEGQLRPQILDRFGLRVVVRGLVNQEDRLEAYRRVQAYHSNPRETITHYATETAVLQSEIQEARIALSDVQLPSQAAKLGSEIIKELKIDSLRAEITLFEAARAHAVADGRLEVQPYDLIEVAPLSLGARRSSFMIEFLSHQDNEASEIHTTVERLSRNIPGRDNLDSSNVV